MSAMSSPRPWGCFRSRRVRSQQRDVFPTPVGVFLRSLRKRSLEPRLPHARGGVSRRMGKKDELIKSSPRLWGCFVVVN